MLFYEFDFAVVFDLSEDFFCFRIVFLTSAFGDTFSLMQLDFEFLMRFFFGSVRTFFDNGTIDDCDIRFEAGLLSGSLALVAFGFVLSAGFNAVMTGDNRRFLL